MNPKTIKTLLERYGVDNPSKIKGIQEKKKQKCFEKTGCISPNQLKSVKRKKKQTLTQHYGDKGFANKHITEKKRRTCLEKLGVDNPMKSETVKQHRKHNTSKFDSKNQFDEMRSKKMPTPMCHQKPEYNGEICCCDFCTKNMCCPIVGNKPICENCLGPRDNCDEFEDSVTDDMMTDFHKAMFGDDYDED